MKAHIIEEEGTTLAYVHPAARMVVDRVLATPTTGDDGRSDWMWVRLPNGDLILGVFPQGDTYCACELDAQYPHPLPLLKAEDVIKEVHEQAFNTAGRYVGLPEGAWEMIKAFMKQEASK